MQARARITDQQKTIERQNLAMREQDAHVAQLRQQLKVRLLSMRAVRVRCVQRETVTLLREALAQAGRYCNFQRIYPCICAHKRVFYFESMHC